MSSSKLMLRILSASVAAANRAGQICRDVMRSGQLNVVDKARIGGERGGGGAICKGVRRCHECVQVGPGVTSC